MKRFLTILLCLPFLTLLVMNAVFFAFNYEKQITFLKELFKQDSLESYIRNVAFPYSHYQWAQIILPLFTIIVGISTFYLIKNKRVNDLFSYFLNRLRCSIRSIKKTLLEQPKSNLYILACLLVFYLARSLFNALYFPIQHDEYWTYNYFSNGSWVKVFSPGNNHFLNSASAFLLKYTFIHENLIFRLSVILGGAITLLMFYLLLVKTISPKIAIVGAVLLCFSPAFMFYAMYGRGYVFLLLFTIICFWSWIRYTQTHERYYIITFTLASFLGFLSVMTFAYVMVVFFLMSVVQFLYKKWDWKETLSFYLPIVIIMLCWSIPGWLLGQWQSTISYKPEVHTEGIDIISSFLLKNSYFFLGFKKVGLLFWLLLVVCFLGLKHINDSWKYWHQFIIISFVSLFVLSFIQGFEITERFAYHLILLPVLAFTFIFTEKAKPSLIIGSVALLCVISSIGAYSHKYLNWSVNADVASVEISKLMIDKGVTEVYLDDNYYKPALIYYYHKENKSIAFYSSAIQSIDYSPFEAKSKFEAIVCDSDNAFFYTSKGYKVAYQNKAATLLFP